MKTGKSSVSGGEIQPVYLETENGTFVKNQPEQITLAEVLKFVSFRRGIEGLWFVQNIDGGVGGNIAGDVGGNVRGNVVGDVGGDVEGSVLGHVGGSVGSVGNVRRNVRGDVGGYVGGSVGRGGK